MDKSQAVAHPRDESTIQERRSREPKTLRGKARVDLILSTAKEIFIHGGYAEMTMRQVAERVGMSLSNLQHYFPSREALLRALLEDVKNSYDPGYADVSAGLSDPRDQLVAVARYLIADTKKAETERLFVEIWSLATRDEMVRGLFDQMYSYHRRNIEKLIAAVNPALSPHKVSLRAALVAMQIEGLMLLISDAKPKHAELTGIEEECVCAICRIVDAPAD